MRGNKNEEQLKEDVNQFHETFKMPMSNAAKFYTLYYIDQEMDIDGFDFYLGRTVSNLAKAFYNYSIFACAGELANIHRNFRIDDYTIAAIMEQSTSLEPSMVAGSLGALTSPKADKIVEDLVDECKRETDGKVQKIAEKLVIKDPVENHAAITDSGVERACLSAEQKYNAFSEPETFLRAAEFVFSHIWATRYDDGDEDYIDTVPFDNATEFGWGGSYGGEAWASVSTTARKKDELTGVTYADLMFSVEHNGGNFIDKTADVYREDMEAAQEIMQREIRETTGIDESQFSAPTLGRISGMIYEAVLPAVLTAARDGSIRPLCRIARSQHSEVRDRRLRDDMFPQKKPLIRYVEEEWGGFFREI